MPHPESLPTGELSRSTPFRLIRGDDEPGDGLDFTGYAAVFGQPTLIDSWEGTFWEQCAAGSFKKSLRETTPKFQFDHGTHPLLGSLPVGHLTSAAEDAQGVRVEARLHDNWLVKPLADAIASGSVDGMSFRFEVVRDRWETADGQVLKDPHEIAERIYASDQDGAELLTRTLLEVKCRELGPVVFPAYPQTSAEVRSLTVDLNRTLDADGYAALARALYVADQLSQKPPAEAPQSTRIRAAEHAEEETEPPRGTDTAAEHGTEHTEPEGLRDAIARRRASHGPRLRFALERKYRYE